MNNKITYLNTDLDLVSPHDLTALAAALDAAGVQPLHVTYGADGLWHATFETHTEAHEPEAHIGVMLAAVEALSLELQRDWTACSLRQFDIGYDCGAEPWGFNNGLSAELLSRLSAQRGSLRITIYPNRD